MKRYLTILVFSMGTLTMSACSLFDNTGVEISPYNVVQTDGQVEIRYYEELVLVSTPMNGNMDENEGAINKLFRYISGENTGTAKIEMTAPVFMDQKEKSENWTMSFVLPDSFDYETAPRPTDPDVTLDKIAFLFFSDAAFR